MNERTSLLGPPFPVQTQNVTCPKKLFWSYVLVFVLYLAVHLFIFRSIVFAIPDLMAGHSVVNTSELVPFFSPGNQLLEQAGGAFSDLTNEYEFRVRYSILTTWMRYYLILPFAIILCPLLGAYLVFLVTSSFLRTLLPSIPPRRILASTALCTLLIHLILLPAKITHFYTLILGFDLFVIALVLLLRGLLLEQRHPLRMIAGSCLVALLNPAVHFLVLYPITFVLLCAVFSFLVLIARRRILVRPSDGNPTSPVPSGLRIRRRIIPALLLLAGLTLIPYGLFVQFYVLKGIGSLKDAIPDTYQAIRDSSLSFLFQTTFDQASATESFLRGTYIPPAPRYGKLFYFILLLVPFILPFTQNAQERRRLSPFLMILGVITAFAMWSSIGYAKILFIPTFHFLLAAIFQRLNLLASPAADIGMQLIAEVIHVLRYPDRFQFIYLAASCFLMPLGVLALVQRCISLLPHRSLWKRIVSVACCSIAFFLPLFAHWEYRTALLTGDFGGFLRPYTVGNLLQIKEVLDTLPRGKTIVLPSSESQLIGQDSEGGTYRFIDKFFIYFLDIPSFYFGLSGSMQNKEAFFLLYQSLAQNEQGWINVLRNLQIRYLIVNKELFSPQQSSGYMKNIARAVIEQPRHLPQYFQLRAENPGFALYEFIDRQQPKAPTLLIDTDWREFSCMQMQHPSLTKNRRTLTLSSAFANKHIPSDILGQDQQKTRLDVYALTHHGSFFRPDQSSLAFTAEQISSSYYFGIVFPMLNVLTASRYNIFRIMMPGPFDTLSSTFLGLQDSTTVRFNLTAAENGTYSVFLRSIATQHDLALRIDNGPTYSLKIDRGEPSTHYISAESGSFGTQSTYDISHVTADELASMIPKKVMPKSDRFDYLHIGTYDLSKGKHSIFLSKNDSNPLVIEGLLLLPVQKVETLPALPSGTRFFSPADILQQHE